MPQSKQRKGRSFMLVAVGGLKAAAAVMRERGLGT